MSRIRMTRKVIRILIIIFTVLLAIILLNFGLHVSHTVKYNSAERVIDGTSDSTDVTVDIHPRGMATDSWEKNDAFEGVILKAKIYEASVTNSSGALLHDWNLRINIKKDCYINNAWNGSVEIHQFVDGSEKVQEVNLLDYSADQITLDYYMCGQDLLIPLTSGDYIVYKPNKSQSLDENEIESSGTMSGQQNIGIIFYSLDGDENLSDYSFTYYLEKSIWDGTEAEIFTVLMPAWVIVVLMLFLAGFIMGRYEKNISIQSSAMMELLNVASDFIDSRKENNEGHSRKVAYFASLIAKKMGMTPRECDNVYYTAMIHDVGKCQLPEYILKKTGNLTNEETQIIKTHTSKGAEMVKNCKSVPYLYEGILHHHERFDGNGYPDGLKGEDIPFVARIISLADSYVTLSHEDEHHLKASTEEIINMILNESGKQFDPVITDAFVEILRESDREIWENI